MTGPRPRRRWASVSLLAALLALGGHVAGGGALPTSCAVLAGVLALAVVATGVATWAARRTRGPWATLVALAVGQLSTEILLSVPVEDAPGAPLLTAAVHALATVALGVLLLGADRSADELGAVADLVLPRWWRLLASVAPVERPRPVPDVPADVLRGDSSPSPRSLRGPPTPV